MFEHRKIDCDAMEMINGHVAALKKHQVECGLLLSELLQQSPLGAKIAYGNAISYLYYFGKAIAAWLKKNPSKSSQVAIAGLLSREEKAVLPYVNSALHERLESAKISVKKSEGTATVTLSANGQTLKVGVTSAPDDSVLTTAVSAATC